MIIVLYYGCYPNFIFLSYEKFLYRVIILLFGFFSGLYIKFIYNEIENKLNKDINIFIIQFLYNF